MSSSNSKHKIKLSLIIPCYNEERTLEQCVDRVREIADESLAVEMIIVDDCSSDDSLAIARKLEQKYLEIIVLHHQKNQGKGAALRTGFKKASGDFVAVQDADLEYDPWDLRKLLVPLIDDEADVVLGSRFLTTGTHSVRDFWHYMGNRFLTFLSNMFTDLRLTDMETCYKVFRRDVIQNIKIKEDRFGFEPEIVAKIACRQLRIFEMPISYSGRTYDEGKKIGFSDALRAIYCIIRYNAQKAPWPIQFMVYLFIGGLAAIVNFFAFIIMYSSGVDTNLSIGAAFLLAAAVNYFLCILILFRRKARWKSVTEVVVFLLVVGVVGAVDLLATRTLLALAVPAGIAKLLATALGVVLNFVGRRYLIFPEPGSGLWERRKAKNVDKKTSLSVSTDNQPVDVPAQKIEIKNQAVTD